MRSRKLLAGFLVAGSIVASIGAAEAAKVSPAWTDAANDADGGQGLGASVPGGFDLVAGTIGRNKNNLEFKVTHADLQPSLPEGFRFLWAFNVDGTDYRLTVKSADIGKPDVLAGESNERVGRVDATGHFRLEGNCETGESIGVLQPINCEPLAYLTGTFDTAEKAFTFPVPMKLVKAKTGSVIAGGGGSAVTICQICWVTHTAERSLNAVIIDGASMTTTVKVPK